jgi:hypothetical protein
LRIHSSRTLKRSCTMHDRISIPDLTTVIEEPNFPGDDRFRVAKVCATRL